MPKRRVFLREAGLVSAGLAALRCGGGGSGSPTAPLQPPPAEPTLVELPLMAIGETKGASGGGVSLAVTRLDNANVVAVSRTCTHQGCTVLLPPDGSGTLDCPCHGSRFEPTGAVVSGPADRPFEAFPAHIEGAQVVVSVD